MTQRQSYINSEFSKIKEALVIIADQIYDLRERVVQLNDFVEKEDMKCIKHPDGEFKHFGDVYQCTDCFLDDYNE